MTARGELFVDEDIRDFIGMKTFNKKFGEDWTIDASRYLDCWNNADLPKKDSVPIRNGNDKIIGYMDFELDFVVEGDGCDKYIEAEIKKAKIRVIRN